MICFIVSTAFLVLELEIAVRPLNATIGAGVLLLLSVLIWLVDIVYQRFWKYSLTLPPDFLKFLIVLGSLLLGLLLSWYDNRGSHNEFAARQYLRIISNTFALITVLWYGLRSKNFRRWAFGTLCLPVVLLPALYLVDDNLRLVNRDYFFRGFTENSSYFAVLLLPAVIWFFTIVFSESRSRKQRLLAFLLLVAAAMLCLAASSRIVWVGALVGCVFVTIRQAVSRLPGARVRSIPLVASRPFTPSKIPFLTGFVLKGLGIFILAFTLAFLLLPVKSKLVVLGRFNTTAYYKFYVFRDALAKDASFARMLDPSLDFGDLAFHPRFFFSADNRLHIWRMALQSFWEHPVGYGPAYNQILTLRDGGTDVKTTHNIFLETALSGGILSFTALLALVVLIVRAIFRNPSRGSLALALTGILLAVSLAFIGGDGLYLRWSWILLGLFLAEMWSTKHSESARSIDRK